MIMFGGEYFDGKKDRTFGDLLIYNRTNNKWSKVTAPRAPLPRLAHQAVGLAQRGGELWMFGGISTRPSRVSATKTNCGFFTSKTCAGSASRARARRRRGRTPYVWPSRGKLVVFGGYFDSRKSCLYYNDLFVFDTETRKWTSTLRLRAPRPTHGRRSDRAVRWLCGTAVRARARRKVP